MTTCYIGAALSWQLLARAWCACEAGSNRRVAYLWMVCPSSVCRLLEGTVERVLLRTEPLLCEFYSWCASLLGAASGFIDGAHVPWV